MSFLVLFSGDKSPNCEILPQINLEVQSSTESDKTVLSVKKRETEELSSVPNSPFSSSPRNSSHNLRLKLNLNLPEIVVQPCSPPPSSPSADSSPTNIGGQAVTSSVKKESSSSTTSSTSSISLGKLRHWQCCQVEVFSKVADFVV